LRDVFARLPMEMCGEAVAAIDPKRSVNASSFQRRVGGNAELGKEAIDARFVLGLDPIGRRPCGRLMATSEEAAVGRTSRRKAVRIGIGDDSALFIGLLKLDRGVPEGGSSAPASSSEGRSGGAGGRA
jgi:hypothetical protein